ncbi:hypothetical protein HY772_04420 [Candidatus Woesearchaeota archaeon]|nr:hypothetical protein [Candidatus Woesearchaeota archaeon]
MELPQYALRPNTNRLVVPWIFKLLGLSAIFYAGIYINVKLLFHAGIPAAINVLIFACLLVLIVIQLIMYNVRFGKYQYLFYTNRVEFQGKKTDIFMFNEFTEVDLKQNLFDKMFNTGSLKLSKEFEIGPISSVTQIKSYFERLVQYYQATQQQYRIGQQQTAAVQQMGGAQMGEARTTAYGTAQMAARPTVQASTLYMQQQPQANGTQP